MKMLLRLEREDSDFLIRFPYSLSLGHEDSPALRTLLPLEINPDNFCRGDRIPARRATGIQCGHNLSAVDPVLVHRRIIERSPFVCYRRRLSQLVYYGSKTGGVTFGFHYWAIPGDVKKM